MRIAARRRRVVNSILGLVALLVQGLGTLGQQVLDRERFEENFLLRGSTAEAPHARGNAHGYEDGHGRDGRGGSEEEGEEGDEEWTHGHNRRLPEISIGVMGRGFNAYEKWAANWTEAMPSVGMSEAELATPPQWDSSLCMRHWEVEGFQENLDPHGYVVFVNGREQLGGNKFLVSDGIFIAKSLTRTLIEYPVLNSRVSTPDAKLGLGAYWDLSELCMYHRILDLNTFRSFVATGMLKSEDFVTISNPDGHEMPTAHMRKERHVREYFKNYAKYKVIVMEETWKSSINREALMYLRPNPFYMGVVRMLLESQKDWMGGRYVALQWRTETATGNLTECYGVVKAEVDKQRELYGLGPHQVFVNTDLIGATSGTYKERDRILGLEVMRQIQQDYPEAFDNSLHRFIDQIEDSGVKAFVSGMAVASAQAMVASSLNKPMTKTIPEANVCQKPYSGYITLISEWREEILKKPRSSLIRLFPFELKG